METKDLTLLWSRRFRLRCSAYAITGLLLALTTASCEGKHSRVTVQNEEPDTGPGLMSTVRMNDPNAVAQLLSGFYGVEYNAWRWTTGKFSLLLPKPPAAQNGATVTLSFTLPDATIRKLRSIRLAASVNGMELKSQEYKAPGAWMFSADIPASLLKAESVKVDFVLDKTMRPEGDKRDLGIIANSVGIIPK